MISTNTVVDHRRKILSMMHDNSILLAFAGDNHYKGPNRNYFYLSNVDEYDNIVVLHKDNNGNGNTTIFIHQYDELKAKWLGADKTKEEVQQLSGIENIQYIPTFEEALSNMLAHIDNVYVDLGTPSLKSNVDIFPCNTFVKKIKKQFPWICIKNASRLFAQQRMIKNEEEIKEISNAIEITRKGIENMLSHMGEMYEYQLESYFIQSLRYQNSRCSFDSIIAIGPNATCLHYGANNRLMNANELVLCDVGATSNMYCSDISRTFPVSKNLSSRQKDLYSIVLNAQQTAFEEMKPGTTIEHLNQVVIDFYKKELKKIGLIRDDDEVLKYYYHGVSHHIGLDVHDLSLPDEPLKAGCIISNEPGLYIKEESIGIRLEDDILITPNGAKWLSINVNKDI